MGPASAGCFSGALVIVAFALATTAPAAAQVAGYTIAGDAIPASLTGVPGDVARGRAIVVDRQRGMCLLCHRGPFPEERFQGDLGPDLAGVGARLTPAQLRLRVVDARSQNPETTMPSYHRIDRLERVGPAWRSRPILSAQDVEDVVALLASLRS